MSNVHIERVLPQSGLTCGCQDFASVLPDMNPLNKHMV